MEYLEIISVRAACNEQVCRVLTACRQISPDRFPVTLKKMNIFQNAEYGTDISVHFHWCLHQSERPGRSLLGIQLAWMLGDFGLINHTVWITNGQDSGDDAAGRSN
jgi:hypothetical protein